MPPLTSRATPLLTKLRRQNHRRVRQTSLKVRSRLRDQLCNQSHRRRSQMTKRSNMEWQHPDGKQRNCQSRALLQNHKTNHIPPHPHRQSPLLPPFQSPTHTGIQKQPTQTVQDTLRGQKNLPVPTVIWQINTAHHTQAAVVNQSHLILCPRTRCQRTEWPMIRRNQQRQRLMRKIQRARIEARHMAVVNTTSQNTGTLTKYLTMVK